MNAEEKEPKGPILGIIIIILLLVVGGVYIFLNQAQNSTRPSGEFSTTTATVNLGPESTSTDLKTIKSELNATNLNGLNAGLDQIKSTLSATSTQ